MRKVKALHVVPDSENPVLRKDQTGEFDYSSGFCVQLFTRTPDARIYYSLYREGEIETPFQLYNKENGIMLAPPPVGESQETVLEYCLKAFAACPGMENTELLERHYIIRKKPYCKTLVTPLLTSGGIEVKNAYRIRDYDNDNMFLFNGKNAALLYDTGFYAKGGDLRKEVLAITGEDKPLYVVLSHNGPDHIQMAWQFVNQPHTRIYINDRDRYMLEKHIREKLGLPDNRESAEYLAKFIFNVKEGDVFDIGDRQFRAFEVPGHTFGCVALLDAGYGDFLAGDCIGANIPLSRGSLWMWNIVPRVPLNDYLTILHFFRDRIRPYKIREIYGGHYNRPMKGEHFFTYLDNLQMAVERLIDYGLSDTETADGYPPFAYVARCQEGSQFTNPYYAAVVSSESLMYEPEYLNGNEEKNADLCYLRVSLPGEDENLLVTQKESGLGISMNFRYHNVSPAPSDLLDRARSRIESPCFKISVAAETEKLWVLAVTGSHFAGLFMDGKEIASDYIQEVDVNETERNIELKVVSEDGTEQRFYRLCIRREER